MRKKHTWPFVIVIWLLINAGLFGFILGKGLALTVNTIRTENFTDFETALPTKLLDINGEVITEFASDEKREIISLDELPQLMTDALLTREDRIFYDHPGFSTKALFRAVVGVLTHSSLGGGSTLTQQIAGTLYCDRSDYSVMRKVREMWWAIQMERRYSKNEIIELYLNKIYFGGGTYGVNAASKYYFGHSAKEITPAEAAILVIQLSNPAYYNPFENPNRAMARQQTVLDAMVEARYLTKDQATDSFDTFWANFDYTRTSTSAYSMREDKAPWFSEYVRRQLTEMLYGSDNIFTGGFTVNTTLNLSHQKAADEIMQDYIAYANKAYQKQATARQKEAFKTYIPLSEMLSLVFNLPSLKVSEQRSETLAINEYTKVVNPVIDILSLINGMDNLKTGIVNKGNTLIKQKAEKTTIEGTMIAIENSTGYIDALVGGSKYDHANQFIRAVQSKLQPGSTSKPLYYSAAIDSQKYTMTSTISDTPIVFKKEDGSPYIPQDFKGVYEGDVQLWYALAHSMNIPSLKILDGIGFDAGIKRIQALTGVPENELKSRNIIPVYPLGLGVFSVRPIEMAKAFATFANNGKEVTPIAIRNIEDSNGNIVLNPEKQIKDEQKAKGKNSQVIAEQTAFIMQELLKKTVESGTLRYGSDYDSTAYTIGKRKGRGNKFKFIDDNGKAFIMPAAGKTGTTQNWADAWTIGFTPYYTAAFWFGFDKPGQSLGLSITGSTLAGVAWGDFMHEVHTDKPYKTFRTDIPEGIIELDVCSVSGDIYTPECGDHKIKAYYYKGTQPTESCLKHSASNTTTTRAINILRQGQIQSGLEFDVSFDTAPLSIDLGFLKSNDFIEADDEQNIDDNDSVDYSEDDEEETNWLLR